MTGKLKATLLGSSLVGGAIPIVELAISRFRLDEIWPAFAQDLEFYLWPTQIALVMGGDSLPITEAPREHLFTIGLLYAIAFLGNIVLYNILGLIGYAVVRVIRGWEERRGRV